MNADAAPPGPHPPLGRLRTLAGLLGPLTPQLRRVVLAGTAGTGMLLLGSLGAGAQPVYDPVRQLPVVSVFRSDAGQRVALALVYVGVAVLGMAWLYLGRAVRRGDPGTEESRLLRIGALWAAPLLFAVPLFSRDMYAYAAQAQLTHAGFDPYTHGPTSLPGPFLDEIDRMWVGTPAPYGPVWLTIGRLVPYVTGGHVVLTVLAMRLAALSGVLLLARYLPRLAAARGVDRRAALWLGLLNPLVLVHFVGGGHNDALMLGLLVAGLTLALEAADERGLVLAVAVSTLAALVKAPAVIGVGFLVAVWAARLPGRVPVLRASARVAAVSLGTFAVSTLASGLGLGWMRQLNTSGAVVTWLSAPTGLGLLVNRLSGARNYVTSANPVLIGCRTAGQVLTVGVLLWLWLRACRDATETTAWARPAPPGSLLARYRRWTPPLSPVPALCLALLAVVMLGPVVQPWYVLWALVLAAGCRLPRPAWMLAAGGSVWLSMMITPQGANLFLDLAPVVASGAAAAVAAWTVLGSPDGEPVPRGPRLPAGADPALPVAGDTAGAR